MSKELSIAEMELQSKIGEQTLTGTSTHQGTRRFRGYFIWNLEKGTDIPGYSRTKTALVQVGCPELFVILALKMPA